MRRHRANRARRIFVSSTEHDDVPAFQFIATIKFGEPRSGPVGDEVGAQLPGRVTQRAADNLLHLAFMQVNAGTKHVLTD